MNPLIHVQLNLELFRKLRLELDRDLFIVGSVLPDIYFGGSISENESHYQSKRFLSYLLKNDPNYASMGVGFMFHGEEPNGLDFYAHKKNGFIEKKLQHVKPLVLAEHPKIREADLTKIGHSLIEFACDYLSDEDAASALNFAFKRTDLKRIAFHLTAFFGAHQHKTYKMLKFFSKFNFQKLRTKKGVSSSVKRFLLWNDVGAVTMLQKYRHLKTQLYFMRKKGVEMVFNEVKNAVQPDLDKFLKSAKKEMAKNLPKHLPPELV